MMTLNGEEGLECDIHIDGIRLKHVSEFLSIWNAFWMNQVQMEQNLIGR